MNQLPADATEASRQPPISDSLLEAIDTAPVLPEARQIVHRAAEIDLRHTAPWFIGLMLHRSALKGGYIPGGSDVDLQLYLADAAFDPDGQLPLQVSTTIHRELLAIDLAPFSYIHQGHPAGKGGMGGAYSRRVSHGGRPAAGPRGHCRAITHPGAPPTGRSSAGAYLGRQRVARLWRRQPSAACPAAPH